MTYNLVIHGGLLAGSTTEGFAHIGVCGEQIAAIGRDLGGENQIDATGLYLPPAMNRSPTHQQRRLNA